MCIGLPMQVQGFQETHVALCAASADASPRSVNCALLDVAPAVGDWLLVHVDTAVRAIADDEAQAITDALMAVRAAAAGEPFEHLLGDLVNREPELPSHLRT